MADYLNVHDIPHRATVARPGGHQIRLTVKPSRTAKILVGCTCTRTRLRSENDTDDHWALFNQLRHDERRAGPFTPVDPVTGRPTPGPAAAEA